MNENLSPEEIDKLLQVSKSNKELFRMKLEHDKNKLALVSRVLYLGIICAALLLGSAVVSLVNTLL